MDAPHPCWADHNHSDERLNLMFAISGPKTEPSRPYSANHDRSDEHLSLSPDDSGYCSPSELHSESRRKPSRSVDATPMPTPAPLATRHLLLEEDSEDDVPERRAEERPWSSRWSFSEEDPESSINLTSGEYDAGARSRRKSSIFGPGLRRACKCVGAAVVAAATKISRGGSGAEQGRGIGGWDGAAGGYSMMNRNVVFREGKRKKVYKKVKRTLLRRKGPVHLKQAIVRTPLDE